MNKERKYITGEDFNQVCNRYRTMFNDWDKLSIQQRRNRINNFRAGY